MKYTPEELRECAEAPHMPCTVLRDAADTIEAQAKRIAELERLTELADPGARLRGRISHLEMREVDARRLLDIAFMQPVQVGFDSTRRELAGWLGCSRSGAIVAGVVAPQLAPTPAQPGRMPAGLHPSTVVLVDQFAAALANKLYAAQEKYGYTNGWQRDDWMDECRAKLRAHVEKGDPLDVAAYCAFLWFHRASTAHAAPMVPMLNAEDQARCAAVLVKGLEIDGEPARVVAPHEIAEEFEDMATRVGAAMDVLKADLAAAPPDSTPADKARELSQQMDADLRRACLEMRGRRYATGAQVLREHGCDPGETPKPPSPYAEGMTRVGSVEKFLDSPEYEAEVRKVEAAQAPMREEYRRAEQLTAADYAVRVGPREPTSAPRVGASASKRAWVKCPVCGEPDMQCDYDEDGPLITCTNLVCASNGGSNSSALIREATRVGAEQAPAVPIVNPCARCGHAQSFHYQGMRTCSCHGTGVPCRCAGFVAVTPTPVSAEQVAKAMHKMAYALGFDFVGDRVCNNYELQWRKALGLPPEP